MSNIFAARSDSWALSDLRVGEFGRRPSALIVSGSVVVVDEASRERARDPQDLERLLVSRERVGDVEGMVALYEPDAVLDTGSGQLIIGREAIRAYFAGLVATGQKFDFGDQRRAIVTGDLAFTSSRFPNGSVSAEVARRQADGTWLWVIDQFSIG